MGEEDIRKDTWTSRRAINMEKKSKQELGELYKDLDIVKR